MNFDKNKVYTALNADELKPGSKVICANYLESLKTQVGANSYPLYVVELSQIMGTSSTNRFKVDNKTFNLAYLVSEPDENNWIVYLCRYEGVEVYLTSCRSDKWEQVKEKYGAKTKLFEGTEEKCDEWCVSRKHLTHTIAAWEDGKTIQFFDQSNDDWEDAVDPEWVIGTQYRVKPEGLKWTDLKVGDIIRYKKMSCMITCIDTSNDTCRHVCFNNKWYDDDYLEYWEKVEQMNLSKEFTEWWISLLSKYEIKREEVFGDKKNEWDMRSDLIYIPVQWVYEAFKAHNEELNRLRKFKKKVHKLQDKCRKYGGIYGDCYTSNSKKSIEYEGKYNEALEEFLYLQKGVKVFMINVRSEAPDKYTFICDTYKEKNFIDLHQNELFDKFINIQTNGKIKNLEDLHKKATDLEFGETSIKYFWYISKELEWPSAISVFQYFVNEEYKNETTNQSEDTVL